MPKLRKLSGRQVCKILETHGYLRVRQKGSHILMQRREGDSTRTVPVPDHSELKIGTLKGIIRQSALPRELFETKR